MSTNYLEEVAAARRSMIAARERFEQNVRYAKNVGHSLGQIATAAGVTRAAIQQILKKQQ